MTLREQFGDVFAKTTFKQVDGDKAIVGKWDRIVDLEDGTYDVWFVGPGLSPLSEQKLAAVAKKLPQELGLTRLNGEAMDPQGDPAGIDPLAQPEPAYIFDQRIRW